MKPATARASTWRTTATANGPATWTWAEFQLDFLAAPLALSLGAEYRRKLRIDAGDPASLLQRRGGIWLASRRSARAMVAARLGVLPGPGYSPPQPGRLTWRCATRNSTTSAAPPTAGFATRYQFDPRVALRASVKRVPRASLVRSTTPAPSASARPSPSTSLAANSPAAEDARRRRTRARRSRPASTLAWYSTLGENVGLNIDAYQIGIRDRIVDSATYSGQEAIDALAAAGISLPASASTVSTHYLANGADTHTRGVDITGHYLVALGEYGQVDWELSANFNRTTLRKNHRGANGDRCSMPNRSPGSPAPAQPGFLGGTWSRQDWRSACA